MSDWSSDVCSSDLWERFKQRFDDWKNERLEGLARPLGRKLWGEMKQNADALSAARASGAIQLFEQFRAIKSGALPAIRLHLIGHSAGGIVHTMLAPRALKSGRSEERRVGKECGSTCRSRWSPYH